MFTRKRHRSLTAIFAAALALLATGCSSATNQSALSSLRAFTAAAHPSTLTSSTTKAASIQRHARQHALAGVRTIETTLHHQPARTL